MRSAGNSRKRASGKYPTPDASDGIVPTLSQFWGHCIAVAQADHLDIIGHHGGAEGEPEKRFDWLPTHCNFRTPQFERVGENIVKFIARSEGMAR